MKLCYIQKVTLLMYLRYAIHGAAISLFPSLSHIHVRY